MEATRRRARLLAVLAALATMFALLAMAAEADAHAAERTRGRFETTAAGVERGYDIEGTAFMLRIPRRDGGRTIVQVRVRGLDPDTTFAAHVHNGACATGGGSHYQHVVGGAVDAVNEIWPTISTGPRGSGKGFAVHDHWARPEARSVVIHGGDGTRLACADLT